MSGWEEPVREFSGKQWQMQPFSSIEMHFCYTHRVFAIPETDPGNSGLLNIVEGLQEVRQGPDRF